MSSAEKFKLAHNCKLNNEIIIQAGTPIKVLQAFGSRVLIEIPEKDYIQKFVEPEDLKFLDTPMWCYDMNYDLDEIDLHENGESENSEEFERHC